MDKQELTEYAQSIADDIVKRRKVKPIKLSVKNTRRGWAHPSRQASIPMWAYSERGLEYFTYYVIHETCHFIASFNHNAEFKRIEKQELKQWGLEIEYRRVYPSKLYANGQPCYTRK